MMLDDLPIAQQNEVPLDHCVNSSNENLSLHEVFHTSRSQHHDNNSRLIREFYPLSSYAQRGVDSSIPFEFTDANPGSPNPNLITNTSSQAVKAGVTNLNDLSIELLKPEQLIIVNQNPSASTSINPISINLASNNSGAQTSSMIPSAHNSDHQFSHQQQQQLQQQQQQQQQQPQHQQNHHYSFPAKLLPDANPATMALNFSHDILHQHAAAAAVNLHNSLPSLNVAATTSSATSASDNLSSASGIDVKPTVQQLTAANSFVDLNPNQLMQSAAVSMNMWKNSMNLHPFKHPALTDHNFIPNTELNSFSTWHHGGNHLGHHQNQLPTHFNQQQHHHNQSQPTPSPTTSHNNQLSNNQATSSAQGSLDGQQLFQYNHHNQLSRTSLPVGSVHESLGGTTKQSLNGSTSTANTLSPSVDHTSFMLNHHQASAIQNSSSTQSHDNQINNLRSSLSIDHHSSSNYTNHESQNNDNQFYGGNNNGTSSSNDTNSRSENRSHHDRVPTIHMLTNHHQGHSNYQQQLQNQQSSLQQAVSLPVAGSSNSSSLKNTGNFRCTTCNEVFSLRTAYQSHLKTHSQDKGAKAKFSCDLCGHFFSQKTSLNRHMKSHTGERPFPCEICGKAFSEKERLKIHMRTHTGEKPFSCGICGKSFSQKSTVKRHQTVHTGEKKFRCDCGKGFANRGNLIAHIKTRGTH